MSQLVDPLDRLLAEFASLPTVRRVFEAVELRSQRKVGGLWGGSAALLLATALRRHDGKALVVTLPGKPASIRVCLDAVFPAVPYCIDLIGGPRLEGNPAVVQVFRPKGK